MKSFNNKLATYVTKKVGTVYCAYLFAVIGIMGVIGAFTNNANLVLIVGAISGYFLQLVLLPIIMVGQNLADKQSKEHHAEIVKHIKRVHSILGIEDK